MKIEMKVHKFILILIFLFCAISSISFAKRTYPTEDRNLWLSFDFEYDVTKKIELEFSEELRYYKNRTILEESLTDFGANYEFTDFFKAGLFYRYRALIDDEESQNELYTNFSFSKEFGKFELSDRIRLHGKFRIEKDNIYNLRNQIQIAYEPLKWLKPYFSTEIFYRFLYEEGDRVTQARYRLGTKFKFLKYHAIDVYFLREQEYNNDKAIHSNVIGIGYSLGF